VSSSKITCALSNCRLNASYRHSISFESRIVQSLIVLREMRNPCIANSSSSR
jgi:hypothetical protein